MFDPIFYFQKCFQTNFLKPDYTINFNKTIENHEIGYKNCACTTLHIKQKEQSFTPVKIRE